MQGKLYRGYLVMLRGSFYRNFVINRGMLYEDFTANTAKGTKQWPRCKFYILKVCDFRVLLAYLLEALVGEYPHVTELYLFKSKEINSLGQHKSNIYF